MLTQASKPTFYARLQFADAISCVNWLETLPLQRPAEAHEMVSAQALLVGDSDLPPLEKLRILEVLYQTANYLQEELAKRYVGCALPLSIVEYSIWNTVVELWQTLLDAYERSLQEAFAPASVLHAHAPLLALRCLDFVCAVVREHHRVYREVPNSLWRRLHELFALAEERGLANIAVADPLAPPGSVRTPAAAYTLPLLTHLSNPYTMSPRQMAIMYRWARLWAALVAVEVSPLMPGTAGSLAVDLGSGAGAVATSRVEGGESIRYLGLEQLGQALRRALAALRQGQEPATVGLGDDCRQPGCERLLTLLYIQWCGNGMESFSAAGEPGEDARACVGLARILRQLQLDPAFLHHSPGVSRPPAAGFEHWFVAGSSTPGFVAVSRGPECDERIQHHQLVALRRRTQGAFQLGVVQSIRLEECGDLAIGLRLLPGGATLTGARFGAETCAGMAEAPAILLPAAPELRTPATLLAPSGFFTAGRELALSSGSASKVRLLRLLERGVDFERAVFEPID